MIAKKTTNRKCLVPKEGGFRPEGSVAFSELAIDLILTISVNFGTVRPRQSVVISRFHPQFPAGYRVAPTGCAVTFLAPGRSHQISPPPITSPIAINCVPVIAPPNTDPRPGSSRKYSRKNRATP
jgi:hypothetical protein